MPVDQAPSPPSRPAARQPDGAKLVQLSRLHRPEDRKHAADGEGRRSGDGACGAGGRRAGVPAAVAVVGALGRAGRILVRGAVRAVWRCWSAASAYFAYRRLWPLCVRAINPVYAAQTIEHGSPSLKNSLINLLLFRQRRSEISDAVYHTLEEQAAHG